MVKLNKRFSYNVSISGSSSKFYDFLNDSETDDYTPFKNIEVINTGTEDLKIYINQQNGFIYVPSGTIYSLDNQEISYLNIENVGTNTADFVLSVNNDLKQIDFLKALVLGMGELER